MATQLYYKPDLVHEYGSWLRGFNWDLFGTLTFDLSRARYSAASRQDALSGYLSALERAYRARIHCFWAEEKRWSGCGFPAIAPHFHVLLGCDKKPLSPDHAAVLWEQIGGRADMRVYDPELDGAEYCAKLIGAPDAHYDVFHLVLPQRKTKAA